jgi:hypothetical protein
LPGDREPTGGYAALLHKTEAKPSSPENARILLQNTQNGSLDNTRAIWWSNWHMEKLEETGFVGIANYIDSQSSWESPEWEALNREFFSVVIDDLLDFLQEYYLPL